MGERHETDLVRMAAGAGEELFPVHRIDKVTSGAVLFAKELRWHGPLTRQFATRTVGKTYLAITGPGGLPIRGVIDLPLSTGRKGRVREAAPGDDFWAPVAGRLPGPDPAALLARAPEPPQLPPPGPAPGARRPAAPARPRPA